MNETELRTWLEERLLELNVDGEHRVWDMDTRFVAIPDITNRYWVRWGGMRTGTSVTVRGPTMEHVLTEVKAWVEENWPVLVLVSVEF